MVATRSVDAPSKTGFWLATNDSSTSGVEEPLTTTNVADFDAVWEVASVSSTVTVYEPAAIGVHESVARLFVPHPGGNPE